MNETSSWLAEAGATATEIMTTVVSDYIPAILAAVLVLLAGWLIGRLVRVAVRRAAGAANRLLDRVFQKGALARARLSPAAVAVLGEIIFWVIMFLAVTVAASIAGFPVISMWLGQVVAQLPNLIIGAAIIVLGYFVSVLVGEQVTSTAREAKAGQSALIGRFAQAAVFVTTLIIGLDQIGVDVTFLVALFSAAVGAVFVGFSVAFGLGARSYVSNLIGARNARRELTPGLSLRIGRMEGEVLEITATHIALDTAEGRVLIPARTIDEKNITVASAPSEEGAADG